jgi:hypothetical protein
MEDFEMQRAILLPTNAAPQPLTTLPKSNAPVDEGGSMSGAPIIVNAYAGEIK